MNSKGYNPAVLRIVDQMADRIKEIGNGLHDAGVGEYVPKNALKMLAAGNSSRGFSL